MALLTYEQLSEKLNIKKTTLYSLVSRGEIPHIRITKRIVRFDNKVINEWAGIKEEPEPEPRRKGYRPIWD